MTLEFPNGSRSFDEGRNAVRFVGYDGMFEVPFFLEADALARTGSTEPSEAECLTAFDETCSSIHRVARKAYAHGRHTTYILTADDFR